MTEYARWAGLLLLLFTLTALVDNIIKRPLLRKWLGLFFVTTGLTMLVYATRWIRESQLHSLPIIAFATGVDLLTSQNRHCRTRTTHPLLVAPTLNLAPGFPDDPLMLHLLQLVHDDVGLPKHQTITLDTSINHDLGCSSVEAKRLMTALKQDFGMASGDYKNTRYFKHRGFDAYLRYVEKGSAGKAPLTIGILYRAIKAKRWDTQTLENS